MSMTTRSVVKARAVGAVVTAAATAVFASTAQAQSAAGPHIVDESEMIARLHTPDPQGGYVLHFSGRVHGVESAQDALRIEVKQGTRVMGQVRCPLDEFNPETHIARLSDCATPSDALMTATGAVSIDLIYLDDRTDGRDLMRTLNVRVNAYPVWTGGRTLGARYQISGDDLLGTAFVARRSPNTRQTEADDEQNLVFTSTFSGTPGNTSSSSLRCSVNGQRLPEDIRGSFGTFDNNSFEVEEMPSQNAPTRRVAWYRARFTTQSLWWGRRVNLPTSGSGYNTQGFVFLAERPGLWSCDLRVDGAVLRTFRFTATADGLIAPHPQQEGPTGLRLPTGMTLIDVRLPNPDTFDEAVNPTAIRASAQYGLRWVDAPAVREMLAALPPARIVRALARRGSGPAAVTHATSDDPRCARLRAAAWATPRVRPRRFDASTLPRVLRDIRFAADAQCASVAPLLCLARTTRRAQKTPVIPTPSCARYGSTSVCAPAGRRRATRAPLASWLR